jgi:PAS domain S-box-containing protein
MQIDADKHKTKKALIAELQTLRAELARSDRADMFRSILDNIPLRLAMKDSEGRYVFVTKALTDAMGMTEEDFIGKTAVETYGPVRGAEIDADVEQVLRTGKAIRGVERVGRINTDLIYRRDVVPIAGRDGKAGNILAISVDVSDRRRAEELLASAVDTLSGPFALWDADERLVMCNENFRLLQTVNGNAVEPGVTVAEFYTSVVEKGIVSIDAEEKAAWLKKRLQRFRNPGEAIEVPRSDGVWLLMQEYCLNDGSTASVGTDITALKNAEQAVIAQTALLRSLVDTIPLRVSLKDAEGRYILVNRNLADAFGIEADEFVGKSILEFQGREDGPDYQTDIRHVLKTGEALMDAEIQSFVEPDKTLLHSIVPIKDNTGDIQFLVTTGLDVSALKNAERELAQHRDHLAELVSERTEELQVAQDELMRSARLATVGKLAGTISHELRNPLGTILSTFYTFRSRLTKPDEKLTPLLDRIDRNITRCVDFIEGMLDYTRLPNKDLVTTDIDAWCQSLVADLDAPDGVSLQTDCQSGVKIAIDQDRMRQAIINLLQNSWQAIENYSGNFEKGSVILSTATYLNNLVIRIRDNGPGVPDDIRNQIFEPLFSTKLHGVGLGLPLVERMIEEIGGTITLEPFVPKNGAVFSITLPMQG